MQYEVADQNTADLAELERQWLVASAISRLRGHSSAATGGTDGIREARRVLNCETYQTHEQEESVNKVAQQL